MNHTSSHNISSDQDNLTRVEKLQKEIELCCAEFEVVEKEIKELGKRVADYEKGIARATKHIEKEEQDAIDELDARSLSYLADLVEGTASKRKDGQA